MRSLQHLQIVSNYDFITPPLFYSQQTLQYGIPVCKYPYGKLTGRY